MLATVEIDLGRILCGTKLGVNQRKSGDTGNPPLFFCRRSSVFWRAQGLPAGTKTVYS